MNDSPRALSKMYASLGINLRKHNGTYRGWGWRDPVVVDLTSRDRKVLEKHGDLALDAHLRAKGQYPFPALTIRRLKALYLETDLAEGSKPKVVLCVGDGYRQTAKRLRNLVKDVSGATLPMVAGSDFRVSDLSKRHVIVLGAAHENAAAATLADRCVLNADARFPGPRGLLVRTVHNPFNKKHNIVHICAGKGRQTEALDRVAGVIHAENNRARMAPVFFVDPDPSFAAGLGEKRSVIKHLARLTRRMGEKPFRLPSRAADLVKPLAAFYDSGGRKANRYNRGPMGVFNSAAKLYDATGDKDYLKLFRGLIWEMILYHADAPGGASYIADMDFELGWFIPLWDAHEEHPIFSDKERLAITNFLLAATEMCAGYKAENWPTRPNRVRHNHETFPALTLYLSGRYFNDYYNIPVAREWMRIARICFGGPMDTRFKLREDANSYQWIVPSHKVFFDRLAGKRRFITSGALKKWAHNVELTMDNFGYPSDFGDTGLPISGGLGAAGLIEAAAGAYGDRTMQWVADHTRQNYPRKGPVHVLAAPNWLPANRRVVKTRKPKTPQLDRMPLDDPIRREHAPHIFKREAFDKIAFRENWGRNAQYLLLDGYSAGSHIHRDQNAIIRFNQLGRIWIVDNGYGKKPGVTNAIRGFSTRELGPEDHNTLIFVRKGGETALPPPLCSLKTFDDLGSAAVVQSALEGYDAADWLRTIVWMKGMFFLVVDQVSLGKRLETLKCQWNMLGDLSVRDGTAVLAQKGVRGFLHWDSDATAAWSSYVNASWEAELVTEVYPYARLPVKKLNQIVAAPKNGSAPVFSTLFYAGRGQRPAFALRRENAGTFVVSGRRLRKAALSRKTNRFALECAHGTLTIRLPQPWH